jgi:hypothetical protein
MNSAAEAVPLASVAVGVGVVHYSDDDCTGDLSSRGDDLVQWVIRRARWVPPSPALIPIISTLSPVASGNEPVGSAPVVLRLANVSVARVFDPPH